MSPRKASARTFEVWIITLPEVLLRHFCFELWRLRL
jgi:hypothetical protein